MKRLGFVALIILLAAVLAVPTAPLTHAYAEGWKYRTEIIINSSDIDSTLTNFPVLVYLDGSNIDWTKVQDDLNDIRFTSSDNITLSYEIENINDATTDYYSLSSRWTTISGDPTQRHTFQPVHSTRILEVNKTIDGASRKYLAYDSNYDGSEIRLYYTDDLDSSWTEYSGNPILGPSANHYRWPSVVYNGTTFHMILQDRTDKQLERWTSTDGINFNYQETVVDTDPDAWTSPFVWLNPNDSKWYLYWKQTIGVTRTMKVRNAINIEDLDSAADSNIFSLDEVLGSPSVMYRDGKYWMLVEGTVDSTWKVDAYLSSSPTSGFTKTDNSPILTNDEACPMHFLGPTGKKAYLFSNRDSANWYQDTREIHLKEAWIWVKVPSISSTVDTIFYMYYGNPTATSGEDAQAVWNDDYTLVQHMVDNLTSTILDSTQYNNDGTKKAANEPIETLVGQIDSAQEFDGVDDQVTVTNAASLNFTDMITIEMWIKPKDLTSNQFILSKGNTYNFRIMDNYLYFYIYVGGSRFQAHKANVLTLNRWNHIVGTYDNITMRLYANGTEVDNTPQTGNIDVLPADLRIGEKAAAYTDATIDEVRFSNSTRSAAWIKASYESGKDALLTFGDEEHLPEIISASILDLDDTDNCYAMKGYYGFTAVVKDGNGAANIEEVYLRGTQGAAVRFEVRATNLTGFPVYSIQTGASIIDLDAGSSSWSENGDEGTATFKVRFEWDFQENNLDIAVYVEDSQGNSAGWTDMQTDYFDVIRRLVTDSFAASDERINKGASATLSGSVRYATTTSGNTASSSYPPAAEFNAVHIHDSGHASKGSDTSIVDGAFSVSFNIPDAVQLNTYHVYLDMAGDYADGDAPDGDTAQVIGDQFLITGFWASNTLVKTGETAYLYATGKLEYDNHAPDGDDSLTIEGIEFVWDWEEERWTAEVSRSTAGSETYDELTAVQEYTYGITAGSMGGLSVTVVWTDYSYNFIGLYSENGARDGNVTLTVHLPSSTDVFEVGGNVSKLYMERPVLFEFPLSGGGSRIIYSDNVTGNVYLFTPDGNYAVYAFSIRDYSGSIGPSDSFLESIRVVNGTECLVERMLIWSTENPVSLRLTTSKLYILQIRKVDDSFHRFGYFVPGAETTTILNIYDIVFSSQAHIPAEHVTVEALRPSYEHVRVNYKDSLDDTEQVFVEVCLLNGTQVCNDTRYEAVTQFNFEPPTYLINNETDYMIQVSITHGFYGVLNYTSWLTGAQGSFWEVPDLNLFGSWPIKSAFAVFIIIAAACLFSRVSAVIGMGVTVLLAAALTTIGWINIPGTVLAAAFALIVMWGLAGGGK